MHRYVGAEVAGGLGDGNEWDESGRMPVVKGTLHYEFAGWLGDDLVTTSGYWLVEAVGTQEAMMQAIHSTRAGGHVGFVGVSHGVSLDGQELFFSGIHLHGGPAPVRRFLPDLIDRIWRREIDPGKVFDLTLPLSEVAAAYQAMDERRAIKAMLIP